MVGSIDLIDVGGGTVDYSDTSQLTDCSGTGNRCSVEGCGEPAIAGCYRCIKRWCHKHYMSMGCKCPVEMRLMPDDDSLQTDFNPSWWLLIVFAAIVLALCVWIVWE